MTNQYSYTEDFAGKIPEVTHKKTATPNISSAAKVYMMSRMQKERGVDVKRNGNDNGQKYMTSEDFVTYFKSRDNIREQTAQRVVKASEASAAKQRPMGEVNADERAGQIIRSASGKMPTRENVQRTKTAAPNVSKMVKINKKENDVKIYSPKAQKSKGFETAVFSKIDPQKLEKIKNVANDWAPKDEIVKVRSRKTDRRFGRMILGMAGVAISLMLIVSGSVMLSDAARDVKALENEVKELKIEEASLRLELDMKNDINILRQRATTELGMIGKEYVEADYLDMNGVDEIKVHEDDEEVGFSAILSAFGIN